MTKTVSPQRFDIEDADIILVDRILFGKKLLQPCLMPRNTIPLAAVRAYAWLTRPRCAVSAVGPARRSIEFSQRANPF
jgi:hypothetical protein